MKTGHMVLEDLKRDIGNFKNELLDADAITAQVAKERFGALFKKHYQMLPAGELWVTLFDKEIIPLFYFIKENRSDIFESRERTDTIIWNSYRDTVIS
jgi:hypothetical protein